MLLPSAFLQTISNSLRVLTSTYVIRIYKCIKLWVINILKHTFFKHSISHSPQTDYKEAQRDKNIFYKRKKIHIIKYLLGERTL